MKSKTVELALGRIFLLLSRPAQEGDVESYEAARRAILDTLDPVEQRNATTDYRPCYAWQRRQGAAGD